MSFFFLTKDKGTSYIHNVMKKSEYKQSIYKNKNILINLTLETFLVYSRHQT